MARKKIIKKKLKAPDEFISFTEKAFIFITHHSKSIVFGGIIVFILILSFFFYQRWEKKKEGDAYQWFNPAVENYQNVSSPYRDGSIQEYKDVLEKFKEVTEKYPGTLPGKISILYQGNLHLRLGEYDAAIQSYESFLKKDEKEKLYHSFALEGLGYAFEGKKDYEKAIDAYQKIIQTGENFQLGHAYLGMGRCSEKLRKNKEALEYYKSFLKISQKSVMANAVLKKISDLEK